jgi:hypothetical protein
MEGMRTIFVIWGLVSVLVGVILALLRVHRLATWPKVVGTSLGMIDRGGYGHRVYSARVRFRTKDDEEVVGEDDGAFGRYVEDEAVGLHYNPEFPKEILIPEFGRLWGPALAVAAFGGIFLALALTVLSP